MIDGVGVTMLFSSVSALLEALPSFRASTSFTTGSTPKLAASSTISAMLACYQLTAPWRSTKAPVGPSAPTLASSTIASAPSVTV